MKTMNAPISHGNENGRLTWRLAAALVAVCSHAHGNDSPDPYKQAERSELQLVAIRDGYEARVTDLFDGQKQTTLGDMGKSGFNASQRYAYPRIEYATARLWHGQDIDSANVALDEYGEYFLNHPQQVLHRDV